VENWGIDELCFFDGSTNWTRVVHVVIKEGKNG